MPRPAFYVTVYAVDLRYGGPEEGGWWYEEGSPVEGRRVVQVRNERQAYRVARRWNDLLDSFVNKGRRPLSSVLSDGRFAARVTEVLPRPFPETRPYYE